MGALKRGLVFFHYFEADTRYRENLVFFLSAAYRDDLDFAVVISGHCSVNLPKLSNVAYVFTENKNNDFGGYVAALAQLRNRLDGYDYFLFVNSSVRGPFLARPSGASWVEPFVSRFSDEVQLVGSSIAILVGDSEYTERFRQLYPYPGPYSHVQTTAYALTSQALRHLLDVGFYDIHARLDKLDVICHYEIRLSLEILRAGWNIKACLEKYNGLDYRLEHTDINPSSRNGDPLYKRAYFGKTASPHELVFAKTNRRLMSLTQLSWATLRGLFGIRHPAILGWDEYRRLRALYLAKVLLLPVTELKRSLDRAVRQTRDLLQPR